MTNIFASSEILRKDEHDLTPIDYLTDHKKDKEF